MEQLGQPARSLCGLPNPEPRARQRGGGDAGTRAGVGGAGKLAQPGRKEWQSLKTGQEAVPFSSKPDAAIQACRFGSDEDCATDFVELASQRGLWERVLVEAPYTKRGLATKERAGTLALHNLLNYYPLGLSVTSVVTPPLYSPTPPPPPRKVVVPEYIFVHVCF